MVQDRIHLEQDKPEVGVHKIHLVEVEVDNKQLLLIHLEDNHNNSQRSLHKDMLSHKLKAKSSNSQYVVANLTKVVLLRNSNQCNSQYSKLMLETIQW